MNSTDSVSETPLRNARLLGIIFLAYAIVLPFITLLIPESELPVITDTSVILSWLLILLMPVEILLVYVFYRFFGKQSELGNIMGPAVLMYAVASAPSIYSLIIGFIGSSIRLIAIPLGLTFSLVGFWLTSMYLSALWDQLQNTINE